MSGTDGAVLQSYEYRENGEKTSSTTLKSDKTWIGGLSVNDDTADSGLYLMGHRHYDATLGRFLSRDPIGFAGGLNLYEYAANSPVDTVDPEGLNPGGRGSRRSQRALTAPFRLQQRATRKAMHQSLSELGMKNLDLSSKTLQRGAEALFRRGFILESVQLPGGQKVPFGLSESYYHFVNPTTGTRVIWDSGNPSSPFSTTQRPHWTIRRSVNGMRQLELPGGDN